MSLLTASRSVDLSADVHISTGHKCKWEVGPAASADPAAFVTDVLAGLVVTSGEPTEYLESVLYLDDAAGNLARAGNSLSVIVDDGMASGMCVVACEQGQREIRQLLPQRDLDARLRSAAPVKHLRSGGLIAGELRSAGVGAQRRFRWSGRTPDGFKVVCRVDDVFFGDLDAVKEGRNRYTCLAIEVDLAGLAVLERLAEEIDARLRIPRDLVGKSQRAGAVRAGR